MNTHLTRGQDTGRPRGPRDQGSVLAMVLMMTVVSSMLVVALLTFVATVLRNRPPVEERAVASETARSAIRQAVHQQRVSGPDGCYRSEDMIQINGLDADVKCYVTNINVDNALMRSRFGVITTANRGVDGATPVASISGSAGSAAVKELDGDVFVNAGTIEGLVAGDVAITGTGIDGGAAGVVGTTFAYGGAPDPIRYNLPPLPGTPADCATAATAFAASVPATPWECLDSSWTTRAGFNPVINPDPTADLWQYPTLPPKPTQERSATPIQIPRGSSTCNVFYPGYYPNGIDANGGEYYFASGIYYFEGPVTIRNGANAVGGEGVNLGCVVDSEAALYDGPTQRAPKVHDITGNGVTFLLGDDATVDVTQASLILNRRLSTPTTRSTEGVSIRSVNTVTTDTADVFVPEDQIFEQDGVAVRAASTEPGYRDSEIAGGYADSLVRFDATPVGAPAPGTRYQFVALGSIFVPNGAIDLKSDNPYYKVQITGGTTSTLLKLDLAQVPADPQDFFIGAKKTAVQAAFRFDAFVTSPSGRETLSSAVMQLNVSREYALNSWTLDIGSLGTDPSNGGAGIGDTGDGGTGGSTGGDDGGSSGSDNGTGGDGTGGDGTGGDGTGGDGTGGADACVATSTWHGDYYDNKQLLGSVLHTSDTADLNFAWGTGSPGGTVGSDDFSARFNRKIEVPTTGMYTFTVSGDNGTRLFVDGVKVYDHWVDDWNYTEQVQVELHAGCANDVTLEYFEGSGGASVSLAYAPYVPDVCLADPAWQGEYWNNRDLSGPAASVVNDIGDIAFDWAGGAGPTGTSDNFSARWTKRVVVPQTAMYSLTMGGDDGYRVTVDGVVVINQWNDHVYQTTTAEVELQAGCANEIVIEYYEKSGQAKAVFVSAPVPVIQTCTGSEDPKFIGKYYNSTNLTNYKFTLDSDEIDFDWAKGSPNKDSLGNDTYSIRWDRTVHLPEPGTYRFTVGGDDGVRLGVNGAWVIDDWSNHSYRERSTDVVITDRCGVDIQFEYYENSDKARVHLDWELLD